MAAALSKHEANKTMLAIKAPLQKKITCPVVPARAHNAHNAHNELYPKRFVALRRWARTARTASQQAPPPVNERASGTTSRTWRSRASRRKQQTSSSRPIAAPTFRPVQPEVGTVSILPAGLDGGVGTGIL